MKNISFRELWIWGGQGGVFELRICFKVLIDSVLRLLDEFYIIGRWNVTKECVCENTRDDARDE